MNRPATQKRPTFPSGCARLAASYHRSSVPGSRWKR